MGVDAVGDAKITPRQLQVTARQIIGLMNIPTKMLL